MNALVPHRGKAHGVYGFTSIRDVKLACRIVLWLEADQGSYEPSNLETQYLKNRILVPILAEQKDSLMLRGARSQDDPFNNMAPLFWLHAVHSLPCSILCIR